MPSYTKFPLPQPGDVYTDNDGNPYTGVGTWFQWLNDPTQHYTWSFEIDQNNNFTIVLYQGGQPFDTPLSIDPTTGIVTIHTAGTPPTPPSGGSGQPPPSGGGGGGGGGTVPNPDLDVNSLVVDTTSLVNGAGTFASTLTGSGAVTFNSTLHGKGAVTFDQTLAVTGNATFGGNLTLGGALVNNLSMVGEIRMWGGNAAPNANWMLCRGQSLNSTTYAALYAVIGHTFGGSGSTFLLPNMDLLYPAGPDGGVNVSVGDSNSTAAFNLGGGGAEFLGLWFIIRVQ